jgi:hypothetical protein
VHYSRFRPLISFDPGAESSALSRPRPRQPTSADKPPKPAYTYSNSPAACSAAL